jgi:polyribonucleotide 5'-hydroxyl-kinase
MVINTCGWVDGLGFELLLHNIKELKADIVLVMGHDKLHAQLENHPQLREANGGAGCSVIKLARSGGVVERNKDYRRNTRDGEWC